ncbi:MAG: acyl-CoA dehydrogenase family protein, partial [Actinobacteria bacterium]|nr:acyl-CoA dehydrogenase family protein [Actinomycetota bacterium]
MTSPLSLALTDDEQLLRDTARAFATERTPVAELRRLRDAGDPLGFSRPLWEEMAALGWAGLPFPAAVGGSEAGYFAVGIVMEELGRTLAATPLLSTVLAGTCLAGVGSPLAEKVLTEAVEGRSLVALVFDDRLVIDGGVA